MHIVLEVASRLLGGGRLLWLLAAPLRALLGLAVGRRDVLRTRACVCYICYMKKYSGFYVLQGMSKRS